MRTHWMGTTVRCAPLLALLIATPRSGALASTLNYPDFGSCAGLGLQGSAVPTGDRIRLTGAAPAQAGGVWAGRPLFVGGGFETVFQFRITERGGADGGGEGFAFVLQNNALPALAPAAAGLGYGGIPNSLAVEFDLRENGTNDEAVPHISLHTRRDLPNSADHVASLASVTNGVPDWADGTVHTARITCGGGTFRVFVDEVTEPVLDFTLPAGAGEPATLNELLGLENGLAWIGFTASTSDAFESHELLSWSLTPSPGPLSVSLASPMEGASFLCPARVVLEATVASTSLVTRVEFYDGKTKIGEASTNSWQFVWKNVIAGTYWLSAVATDEAGHKSVSAAVRIAVLPVSPPIGLNFSTGRDGTNHSLTLATQAGAIEHRVWNNLTSGPDASGLVANLRTGAGTVAPIRVFWDFGEPDDIPAMNPAFSGNHTMMKAGLIAGIEEGVPSEGVVVVQQIPYDFYDVLVYSDGPNGQADQVAQFRIGNQSIYLRDAAGTDFSSGFVQAHGTSDTGISTPAGNYVRFNSLTNSSFSLTVRGASTSSGPPRAVVNAIQIVPSVDAVAPLQVTRGPYLQIGTPTSMTVRWRTSRPAESRVRFGPGPSALTSTNDDLTLTTEHVVVLTNLQPATLYYYAIGTTETNLVGGNDCSFTTSPLEPRPTRVWFISDYGYKNSNERAVRDSYVSYIAETKAADVWITGGDNDQSDGRDANAQIAIFGTEYGYGNLLRRLPMWPTIGNHDHQTADGQAYYNNFSLPTHGEAGGVPSGTEHYYSFNYGDIHFVSLDSVDDELSSSADTPMFQWLREDLAAATQQWTIAYWHGPPYTKGSHDSDNDGDTLAWMTRMREYALPILESHGVDLVLCGHSHVYERSWLLHGHYGYSWTFSETNKVDGGDGQVDGTGPYLKPRRGAGTVYLTAGVGSQPQNHSDQIHPAHLLKMTDILGSLVIDVDGSRLDCRFMGTNGGVLDYFTILKEPHLDPPAAPASLIVSMVATNRMELAWPDHTTTEMRFILERSADGVNFLPLVTLGANMTNYVDTVPTAGATWFYRVCAWNDAGRSDYSEVAVAGPPLPLRITGLRPAGNAAVLSWQSMPGRAYTIEHTAFLHPPEWQTIGPVIMAAGYLTSWEVPADLASRSGFYRLTVSE